MCCLKHDPRGFWHHLKVYSKENNSSPAQLHINCSERNHKLFNRWSLLNDRWHNKTISMYTLTKSGVTEGIQNSIRQPSTFRWSTLSKIQLLLLMSCDSEINEKRYVNMLKYDEGVVSNFCDMATQRYNPKVQWSWYIVFWWSTRDEMCSVRVKLPVPFKLINASENLRFYGTSSWDSWAAALV